MLQAAGGPGSLTRAQLLQAMQSTALDIETPGAWDRDSGAGIIDALAAVSEVTSDLAVTVSFAQPTYTATEGGAAAPVMVHLSDALDRVVTIPLGTDPFGTDVTEADYTLEAVAPARITVPDPARPWLLDLTIAASTTVATLMVTAVADTEEDPGGVYIGIRGDDLPPGVTEGVPNNTSVEFYENVGNFTDPLTSLATPIKAVHFDELRTRIAALRARERLPAVQWTDPTLTAGVTRVRSVHLTELRAALDAVYDAVGQTRPGYTDAALTTGVTAIKAVHVMELRAAIVTVE